MPMPYSVLLRGFLRTMSLRPSPLKPFSSPPNPRNPRPHFSFIATKPLSLCGAATFRLPPRRSLVVLASSTTRSVDSDWRESLGIVFNTKPAPFSPQPSSPYSCYAYDDFSEDESDGDVASSSSSSSSQKVSFLFEFLVNLTSGKVES